MNKLTSAAALAALALTAPAQAQTRPDGQPARLSAAELRATVAHVQDGLATHPLPTGAATVLMVRRERSGEVELHMAQNDVFVAHDGHATVLIGDSVAGDREVSPGEWRGGKLSGGRSYSMGPGDVLWIPAGLPHQVVLPRGGSFNYLALKYASAKRP
jgi:mannose-6-phosphate isomerase-like protein (cupin superfamily)